MFSNTSKGYISYLKERNFSFSIKSQIVQISQYFILQISQTPNNLVEYNKSRQIFANNSDTSKILVVHFFAISTIAILTNISGHIWVLLIMGELNYFYSCKIKPNSDIANKVTVSKSNLDSYWHFLSHRWHIRNAVFVERSQVVLHKTWLVNTSLPTLKDFLISP